jgi:hypothetical protein
MYLRIYLNFFSVHEEINSNMWYTPLRDPRLKNSSMENNINFLSNQNLLSTSNNLLQLILQGGQPTSYIRVLPGKKSCMAQ